MAVVCNIYDHKTRRFIHGHMVVTAALIFRGVVLPWKFDLWIPKEMAGNGYRKITQIAAQMINAFALLWDLKMRVLCDACYLAPCVFNACKSKGFSWFSVAAASHCE
jgi:hypothetical protein